MSDVVPQCYTCKYNPCKWYSEEERKEINVSYELCPHSEETDEAKKFYKSLEN